MSIMSLTLAADLALRGVFPSLHRCIGPYLPTLASNCVVIAAMLLSMQADQVTRAPISFASAIVMGFATGIGFTLVLVLLAGVRQRIEFSTVPSHLRGIPVTLLSFGLLSLAFMGLRGLHFFAGRGW